MKRTSRMIAAAALAATMPLSAFAAETATVTSKLKDLSIRMYGFVEADAIADTTQGFTEEQGNNLVPMRTGAGGGANNFAGQQHRTELSVRNSRLGFDLTLPKTDSGFQPEAVIELDFLGNQGINTTPGNSDSAATTTQSERDFFNNPAVRVRHAYLNLTYNDWNAKVGQYWSLLGWQPYYFPGETVVLPSPGMLYRRFAQARVTHTCAKIDGWTIEAAADAAKPAEMNSGNPEGHAGLRIASTQWKAASISGSGSSMLGLSAAASGALIPTVSNGLGNRTGKAYAFDVSIPVIPSSDGKDRSNNLILIGEASEGDGVGGLEYSGLSLGVKGITAAQAGSAIDSGIAGINNSGEVELVKYRTFRGNLQYTLNNLWSMSAGYAQVEGRNLSRFTTTSGSATLAPKIQFGYLAAFYDPYSWLRLAAEVNQTRDSYNDDSNRHAANNRYQFTTFFLF